MMTHDTKKVLVQTIAGQIANFSHLIDLGFGYVLLRDLQNNKIEGEFSVHRQSTTLNVFITASDMLN